MGWPKGKPRKPKESSAGEVTELRKSPKGSDSDLSRAAGPRKRDPARKLNAEIQKVLKQLEAWRAKVAELEKTVADMTQALTGAVPKKVTMPPELMSMPPQMNSGPPAPLAPQDQEEGRWV